MLIYSISIETNCLILKLAYEVCLRWVSIYGATFAFKKYKLIYLIRRLKRFNIKAVVDFKTIITELKSSIRVLGL